MQHGGPTHAHHGLGGPEALHLHEASRQKMAVRQQRHDLGELQIFAKPPTLQQLFCVCPEAAVAASEEYRDHHFTEPAAHGGAE